MKLITNSQHHKSDLSVVLVSNGPGELSTWVKPIAEKLHEYCLKNEASLSISLKLVLVPCPNATGNEKEVAEKWNIFENISTANDFWKLLIRPKKYGFWPAKGIVVFLGGDQFWSILLSARLKYKNIVYAEWIARWPFWNDRIAAMSPKVKQLIPKKFQERCRVVGDLMADLQEYALTKYALPQGKWIAILPGSKKAKLSVGIPFFLDVADQMASLFPNYQFLIPIAPTTNINEIKYYNSSKNPIALNYNSKIKKIIPSEYLSSWKILITSCNTKIHLVDTYPAYNFLSQCDLALTTVGANTAELGALGVPMIVVLPTQYIHVMDAWDGLIGIITRIPILKRLLGFLLGLWRIRKNNFMAWPNIKAKRMIVPERIGHILPKDIAIEANDWLNSPKRLIGQKEDLRALRGEYGAVKLMIKEITDLINEINISTKL